MWLLLDTNRKSYVGSPTSPSDYARSDLEGQSEGHSDFNILYIVKVPR